MHLASRIFDVVTDLDNIFDESVRNIIPEGEAKRYWRSVLRAAALCHDLGHLPFSHAAEKELLPKGFDHETLTKKIIACPEMREIWQAMTPPLRHEDIIKLAVGPEKAEPLELNTWESILAEIIIGDAFGADRMDYLLRDAYHAGVEYGKFDHNRLISSLRILPSRHLQSDEPALGLEAGGLESSEGLMIARYFMYKQVYLHHIRRVYDIHLKGFLKSWLTNGFFSTNLRAHSRLTDVEVLAAIRKAYARTSSPHHLLAERIQSRDHFRRFYSAWPSDQAGGVLEPGKIIAKAAVKNFGKSKIRYDYYPPKVSAPDFPVRRYDGKIVSSLKVSPVLEKLPVIGIETVYCDKDILIDAEKWREETAPELLRLRI